MSIQKFTVLILLGMAAWSSSFAETLSEVEYRFKKAQIQYNNQMYRYAVENLEKVLILDPKHSPAANVLAAIYKNHYKDNGKALAYYLMSLEINDAQPFIHLEAGRVYYFFSEYSKAINHLQRTIAQKNDIPAAHFYLALIYNVQKHYDAAAFHIAQCYNAAQPQSKSEAEKALEALALNDSAAAIIHYKKALEINPVDKEIYLRLVVLYRTQKRIKAAIELLESCLNIYPNDSDILMMLAHCYFEYKNPQRRSYSIARAADLCKRAAAIDPSRCDAYSLLFLLYKTLHNVPLRDKYAEDYAQCLDKR